MSKKTVTVRQLPRRGQTPLINEEASTQWGKVAFDADGLGKVDISDGDEAVLSALGWEIVEAPTEKASTSKKTDDKAKDAK